MKEFKRIYAKIHLDYIEENMAAMQRNLTAGTMMIGVVKSDGYGHGAVAVAKTIDPFVAGFAVATVEEALELRRHGIQKGILILGPVPESQYDILIKEEIRPAIFDFGRAKRLSDLAAASGRRAKIHIAVDVGMSRIGFLPTKEAAAETARIAELPGILIEGMFTHFSRADEADKTSAREELLRFSGFVRMVRELGVSIPICHCSNSAGIVDLKEANMDAVRPGITIYGLYPSDEVEKASVPLKPAMELKSFITYIKDVKPGTKVSYGGTFEAERPMRIATISAGYGDGYPRSLSGRGHILVHGRPAPILGRVCMDQFMADVTEIPEAKEGDEVTLLGRDGDARITMEELAALSGGFHYEIPCLIGKRVPRLYVSRGRIVGTMTSDGGEYEGLSDESPAAGETPPAGA